MSTKFESGQVWHVAANKFHGPIIYTILAVVDNAIIAQENYGFDSPDNKIYSIEQFDKLTKNATIVSIKK